MKPTNAENFLIEVTPEQLDELRGVYKYSDEECYAELHYSPYWSKTKNQTIEVPIESVTLLDHDGVAKVFVGDINDGKKSIWTKEEDIKL